MSLFAGLGEGAAREKITDPARLFRSLPNRQAQFVAPRDIQTEVWKSWYSRRDEQDLVLKMNTGSGKTVVGLIILLSSLNEGAGPAVYLVPDKQLQEQVLNTARALDISVATEVDDTGFRRGESVLVITMAKLVNGLSKFGVRGAAVHRRVPIGTIVVDDAHASIPIVENQFSIVIKRSNDTYDLLLRLFSDDIKSQSLSDWTSIVNNEGSSVVAVPYWAWNDKLDTVGKILASQSDDSENKFTWPLIKANLGICDMAISPREIEIALSAPNMDAIPSYAGAKRRIYMTATLADDSVVASKLGANPLTVVNPVAPEYASDLGDRMILMPMQTSNAVGPRDIKELAVRLSSDQNVVVLVPSRFRAQDWSEYSDEIHDAATIRDCVKRLNEGHVGLVVLVAKYDGLDLPGDACRVLIIDGLPERYSPVERIELNALGTSDVIRVNQIQRVEQGMGRGIRSATDYVAVVLLDPRLVERLYMEADRAILSPGTRAQLDLSDRFASTVLKGKSVSVFEKAIRDFLGRDPAWTQPAKDAIDALPYPVSSAVPQHVVAERKGFEAALQHRYLEAGEAILAAISVDSIPDALQRGWLKQRAASYIYHIDPTRAREIQRSALIDNNWISRPPMQIAVKRITLARQQSNSAMAHITDSYSDAKSFEVKIEALLADLAPVPVDGTHKKFEAALEELGRVLGFASARPDHDSRIGPDNLWAIGGDHYFVLESKSEAIASHISRSDLEQLTHSADWFESTYTEERYTQTPIIIHPSRSPFENAVPRQGARVMTFDKLAGLRQGVRLFAQSISQGMWPPTEDAVKASLTNQNLLGSQMRGAWTQSFD